MIALIAITECASMPGRFTYSLQARRTVLKGRDAGADPAAAAAKAMELAICHGRTAGYAIFGPQKVLDHIPPALRARAPDHG